MKKLFLCLIIGCSLWACSDNSATSPDPGPQTEPFTEGQVNVKISMPNHPALGIYVDVMQQVNPEAGDVEGQMETIIQNLSTEDQQALEDFFASLAQGNDMGSIATIFSIQILPLLENVIYVRDSKATAKFTAFTYHGETRFNQNTSSGQYYLNSRSNPENQLSFTYTAEEFLTGFAQTVINDEFYSIKQTDDTQIIAGFTATKSIYTLKDTSEPAGPYKLVVWTSNKMPKVVNYAHPFYLSEEGGVVKIKAYLTPDETFAIVYEFTEVIRRSVSDQEMAIQESNPMYDYGEDFQTINQKLFEVLFGASQ